MSTRSRIGLVHRNGTIASIYTHSDGHPSHHVAILTQHYDTADKVQELLDLGDLSILAPEIGEPHSFNGHSHPDWCRAYGRDRGDTDIGAQLANSHTDFIAACRDCNAAYGYLFRPDSGWYVAPIQAGRNAVFMPVGELRIA